MIGEKELLEYYEGLKSIYEKALHDVRWHLDKFLTSSKEDQIAKIYTSSKITQRVKAPDSLLRKCRRDGVSEVNAIPNSIEDILGIRIATVNKDQARKLWEYLSKLSSSWFCKTSSQPNFVPYTISDKNNYSLKTGYQAYHVTFVYEHSYSPLTSIGGWPVEIQVMAQLWEFWAEYSRKYFYGGSGITTPLLPYNVAISKILDSADDLMLATTEMLLQTGVEKEKEPVPKAPGVGHHDVGTWFEKNANKYFGRANTPIDLFLLKIGEELNLYGITLEQLEKLLQDKEINARYDAILRASRVAFLAPYQKILTIILLSLGWESERIVERVNDELWLLGINLKKP